MPVFQRLGSYVRSVYRPIGIRRSKIRVINFRQVAPLCLINLMNFESTDVFRIKRRWSAPEIITKLVDSSFEDVSRNVGHQTQWPHFSAHRVGSRSRITSKRMLRGGWTVMRWRRPTVWVFYAIATDAAGTMCPGHMRFLNRPAVLSMCSLFDSSHIPGAPITCCRLFPLICYAGCVRPFRFSIHHPDWRQSDGK